MGSSCVTFIRGEENGSGMVLQRFVQLQYVRLIKLELWLNASERSVDRSIVLHCAGPARTPSLCLCFGVVRVP